MFWLKYKNEQVDEVFRWLSGIVGKNDVISVESPSHEDLFLFSFPVRCGDYPKKIKTLPSNSQIAFRVFILKRATLIDPWKNIFSSPHIELWENITRNVNFRPLRWGLSEDEQKLVLHVARKVLAHFLTTGKRYDNEQLSNVPPRLFLKCDFDVALWVNGSMRGSSVVLNNAFAEGLIEGVIQSSRDLRFKPLSIDELPNTRIEITLFSELHISLSPEELKSNIIYPEKGYVLSRKGKRGWFLPEIFNIRYYRDLNSFLRNLAVEKAGLQDTELEKCRVCIFEIQDFIEAKDRMNTLSLYGPIVAEKNVISWEKFISKTKETADWLIRIQEPDGNIPPIIDPTVGHMTKQIDWPRLAFTAWALAEFGKSISNEQYIYIARKSFYYLKKYILEEKYTIKKNRGLTLAYLGQLGVSLNEHHTATKIAEIILSEHRSYTFDAIMFSQIASFYNTLEQKNGKIDAALRALRKYLMSTLKQHFLYSARNNNTSLNLASWAELANTFLQNDPSFAQKIEKWLLSHQFIDGAFPSSPKSNYSYVRGSGKILEILALNQERNKKSLDQCLNWIFSFQYNKENVYFLPEKNLPLILGAFRHDYFRREAWIDATGHVLLSASRLINKI